MAQVDHPKNFAVTLPDYDLTKTPLKADIIKMAQARYNVTMPQVEGSRKSVLEDGTKKMAIENVGSWNGWTAPGVQKCDDDLLHVRQLT